jgi:hypothetical protein
MSAQIPDTIARTKIIGDAHLSRQHSAGADERPRFVPTAFLFLNSVPGVIALPRPQERR